MRPVRPHCLRSGDEQIAVAAGGQHAAVYGAMAPIAVDRFGALRALPLPRERPNVMSAPVGGPLVIRMVSGAE
jgi:hypothetical protein